MVTARSSTFCASATELIIPPRTILTTNFFPLRRFLLLQERRHLIGARPPRRGHRRAAHPQIHAELPTVLIPVAQHDVAQQLRPRLHHEFLVARHPPPRFVHRRVVPLRQYAAHGSDALVVLLQDLRAGR